MSEWQRFLDSLSGASGSIAQGGYGVTLPGPGVVVGPNGTISPDPSSLTSMISYDVTSAGNVVSSAAGSAWDKVTSILPSKADFAFGVGGLIVILILVLLVLGKFEAL